MARPLSPSQDKEIQGWYEWDGFGPYKYRAHRYPNNFTLRDVQRRRIFQKHAKERMLINTIRKNDILPKASKQLGIGDPVAKAPGLFTSLLFLSQDLRRLADQEIVKVPRDSSITRPVRCCTLTGRRRGIFHQFRVSRIAFRMQADYNKVSGVQRAHWMYGIHIKP